MMVSVCITTYNHELFISQALDNVLSQQVNFDFEILLGEDESSDRTREIVRAYATQYPERIRLFLHDHPADYQRINGRNNFVNNLKNARGKYIALLDGDDFWTSPHKLQKQVDLLEAHPECCGCFHNVMVVYDDAPERDWMYHSPDFYKPFFYLKDLVRSNFIPTCSAVFRAGLFGEFPDWFMQMPMADWPLHILNAQYGPYAYIYEPLAAYRVHGGGIWSHKSRLDILNKTIHARHLINDFLKGRFSQEYGKVVRDLEIEASDILIKQMEFRKAFYRLFEAFWASPTSCSKISKCFWRLLTLWIGHIGGNSSK